LYWVKDKTLKFVKENTNMVNIGTVDDVELIPKKIENISGIQLEEILNLSDSIMEQVSKLDS